MRTEFVVGSTRFLKMILILLPRILIFSQYLAEIIISTGVPNPSEGLVFRVKGFKMFSASWDISYPKGPSS